MTRLEARSVLGAALILACVHAALVAHFVPVRAVFSDAPLRGGSYDRHYAQALRVAEARGRWGQEWLYDVQLDAGQPEGTLSDLDGKTWNRWVFALGRLGVRRSVAFNTFALLIIVACPLLVFAIARAFRYSRATSLLASALAVLLWFFDSYLHWTWHVGMIAWCGAATMALLALAQFQRWLLAPSKVTALACATAFGFALMLHPAALITLACPMLVVYVRSDARPSQRQQLLLFVGLLIALAANLHWLRPAFQHRQFFALVPASDHPVSNALLCDLISLRCDATNTGGFGTRTGLRLLCLSALVAGMWLHRGERNPHPPVLVWGIASGLVVAYVGASFPELAPFQLYQQLVPAVLLSTIPAAAFAVELVTRHSLANMPRLVRVTLLLLAVALCRQYVAAEVSYFLPELSPEPKLYPDGARSPLSKFGFPWLPGFPSTMRFRISPEDIGRDMVVRWLHDHVAPTSRILVDDAALGEAIARHEPLEVLGGERQRWLEHTDAAYRYAPNQKVAEALPGLAEHIRLFAIDWVVGSASVLRRSSWVLEAVEVVAGYRVCRAKLPTSRVLEGGGRVLANSNRLEVYGSAPAVPLLLSYHWHPALACRPDCRVEREFRGSDRVGFIRIPAPHPSDVTVWNTYEVP